MLSTNAGVIFLSKNKNNYLGVDQTIKKKKKKKDKEKEKEREKEAAIREE